MKESEAKTKWCPFARVAAYSSGGQEGESPTSVNRGEATGPFTRCIGAACMSWRWIYAPSEKDVAAITKMRMAMPAISRKTDEGFCGLAGKP